MHALIDNLTPSAVSRLFARKKLIRDSRAKRENSYFRRISQRNTAKSVHLPPPPLPITPLIHHFLTFEAFDPFSPSVRCSSKMASDFCVTNCERISRFLATLGLATADTESMERRRISEPPRVLSLLLRLSVGDTLWVYFVF